jgi:hypothetical protein
VQIFSIHPFCNEAIVLMPDKNLRGMTALSVFFGKFYCSAERLCFAWEICDHMAMSISDLPSAILVQSAHHRSRIDGIEPLLLVASLLGALHASPPELQLGAWSQVSAICKKMRRGLGIAFRSH